MAQPTTYQRVTTSTDYDVSAGELALVFDGIDDSMYTAASVDFNGLPVDGQVKRNLLSASEAFDDAVWLKSGVTVTANAAAGVEGLMTADKIVASAATGVHAIYQARTVAAGAHTFTVRAKAGEYNWLAISMDGAGFAFFNLTSGTTGGLSAGHTSSISAAGGGYYDCKATYTFTAGSQSVFYNVASADNVTSFTGDGVGGIFVAGAQLEAGSAATAYQKTGTDKMTVFAGVHKASDAAVGTVAELSSSLSSSTGSFVFFAPASVAANVQFASKGTTIDSATKAAHAAPVTSVCTALSDISGAAVTLRVNTAVAQTGTYGQGTGNYGNYPLYVGRRNNASLPFNGRLYQLAIKGKALSAAEITTVEALINSRTKAF